MISEHRNGAEINYLPSYHIFPYISIHNIYVYHFTCSYIPLHFHIIWHIHYSHKTIAMAKSGSFE